MEHLGPDTPERRSIEAEVLYAPGLHDIRTMHRTLAWIKRQDERGEIALEDEHQDGIESLGGLLESALAIAVSREPELAASMVDVYSGSPDPFDRGLACDVLRKYHYQLIAQDAVADASYEAGRWRRLIDEGIPGHEKDWFQAAAGFVIEHTSDVTLSDQSQAFVEALRTMVPDE